MLCIDVPRIEYNEALALQRALVDARITGSVGDDILIMLEHPPVFTLGRSGVRTSLLVAEGDLAARGIQVIHAERGGDVTYHGPGQLVVYPILNLKALHWSVPEFVGALEHTMIRTSAHWGIKAEGNPVHRGVWIGNRKLGSVGVAVRKHISFHGFALNVNTDLEPFTWIDPCGISGCLMTSMREELGTQVPMSEVRQVCARHVEEIFGMPCDWVSVDYVLALLGRAHPERLCNKRGGTRALE